MCGLPQLDPKETLNCVYVRLEEQDEILFSSNLSGYLVSVLPLSHVMFHHLHACISMISYELDVQVHCKAAKNVTHGCGGQGLAISQLIHY